MALSRPPLYTVPLNWFPLFSLVKWSQVMLLLLRTEHCLDEIQHGYVEKREVLFQEHRKKHLNNEQGSPANALLTRCPPLTPGLRGPGGAAATCCSETAARGDREVAPPATKPKKPKFGDTVGYSLKSSFYQSCLISFNKSDLFKWLMIVRILPRAKYTVISLSYSVFKKIKLVNKKVTKSAFRTLEMRRAYQAAS